jgi:hypothetical protein
MATSEEKQELVDTLSGPRYYHLQISGYGGEASYMSISKEAHDFWKDHKEQYGDYDLVQYITRAEDGDFDFEDIEGVPTEAEFMTDEDGDPRPWYEPPNEIDHTFGASYDSSYITVDEVDGEDYSAKHIREVIDREDLSELNDRIGEETEWSVEVVEPTCCEEPEAKYIAQMYSSEKGTFFDGIIETVGDFDPKKLKIHTVEYLNGEDTVTEVWYDGVEVDNNGGDTNGKGYYADVWEN